MILYIVTELVEETPYVHIALTKDDAIELAAECAAENLLHPDVVTAAQGCEAPLQGPTAFHLEGHRIRLCCVHQSCKGAWSHPEA